MDKLNKAMKSKGKKTVKATKSPKNKAVLEPVEKKDILAPPPAVTMAIWGQPPEHTGDMYYSRDEIEREQELVKLMNSYKGNK